ncbi:MAG TPA: hypothetical protein VF939_04945 [Puia sp.]
MQDLEEKGFKVIENIFTEDEIACITAMLTRANADSPAFRKTNDLFAIRQFLKEVPGIQPLVFNSRLKAIIKEYLGPDYFLIKSIYFDKPEESNWFVAWYQDLLLHASNRTTNRNRRRVVHIEFSNRALPGGLSWAELLAHPLIFPKTNETNPL